VSCVCREWRKRKQERRERKRARHEARRARQGEILLQDVQGEDDKRLEQLEEGEEEKEEEEEGLQREEGVLESGWGPTAMDDDVDDGYGDGDRDGERSGNGDGGESGRLGDSTKTGPDRW
jgi:hypothetical protein